MHHLIMTSADDFLIQHFHPRLMRQLFLKDISIESLKNLYEIVLLFIKLNMSYEQFLVD